jgi:hypothetical protein
MINFLLGLIVVLLPERLRQKWLPQWHGNLRASAVVSGIAQMLTALGLLIFRYPRFVSSQLTQIYSERLVSGAAQKGGETAVAGMGIIFLLAYILLPVTMLLIYFAFEAAVRFVAAGTTGESVGTLPLVLADFAIQKWNGYYTEKKQGLRVPDLVSVPTEGSGYDLAIASCRQKPDWDHLLTISYNETLYEVADYADGDDPRRHVYHLRRAPLHKVVRGLHRYDPEEVMKTSYQDSVVSIQ